jgi:hypothetical protein
MRKPPPSLQIGVTVIAAGLVALNLAVSHGRAYVVWPTLAFVLLAVAVTAWLSIRWYLITYRGWVPRPTYAEAQERREREETERAADKRAIEEFNYAVSQIKSELLTHRGKLHEEITSRSYGQPIYYRDAYNKYRPWLAAYAADETHDSVHNAHEVLTDLSLRGQERDRAASNESDFRDPRWLRLSGDELPVRIAARDAIDDAVARLAAERREWQESVPLTRRARLRAFVRRPGRGGRAS